MKWYIPPACQGQILEYSYASDCECWLYRRVHDRSDRTSSYSRAPIEDNEFEPWNVEPSITDWEPCEDPDPR